MPTSEHNEHHIGHHTENTTKSKKKKEDEQKRNTDFYHWSSVVHCSSLTSGNHCHAELLTPPPSPLPPTTSTNATYTHRHTCKARSKLNADCFLHAKHRDTRRHRIPYWAPFRWGPSQRQTRHAAQRNRDRLRAHLSGLNRSAHAPEL